MEFGEGKNGGIGQDNLIEQRREERENSIDIVGFSYEEWGKIAISEIERMIRIYPVSHGENLKELLDKFSKKPEELEKLLISNPILNKVVINLKSNEINLLFEKEGDKRQYLQEWYDVFKKKFKALTFVLFTDGQEIVVGTSEDGGKSRLFFRKKLNLSLDQIRERLAKLGDLVPKIEIFEDPNRQSLMFEASYIEGRYANQEEIEEFKKKLAEKGFDPNKFDLNSGNLIVDPNGRIYFVDMDDIIIGF